MKTPDSKRRNTYLVALIISIILFYILTHLPELTRVQQSVGAYFNTVTIGCIIAYLMNPLAKFYERKLFKNLKRGRWALSVFCFCNFYSSDRGPAGKSALCTPVSYHYPGPSDL